MNGAGNLKMYLAGGVKYAAIMGMVVGGLALLAFILGNASLDVVASGEFRGTTIQVGTGKFFYLAYLLLPGSVLFSCYLLSTGQKWRALVPVFVSTALYWPLGGRGRALTSLLGGLLLVWYCKRERSGWKRMSVNPFSIVRVVVAAMLVVWLLYVGSLYRGNLGIRAFPESLSLSGLWGYVEGAAFKDIGQLHSLAAAVAIGPGVIGGDTFIGALTWPLNQVLPIPGRSAGVFIVETLAGFVDERKWGVHATLLGDAYLNFGLLGVVIVMLSFGGLFKVLYIKFRDGRIHIAIYVLAFLYGQQMLLGSIEVWPHALTVLAFTFPVMLLGRTVFSLVGTGNLARSSRKGNERFATK
jgi:hypothetical protein